MVKNNTTGEVLMRKSSLLWMVLFALCRTTALFAQDKQPLPAPADEGILHIAPLKELMKIDSVFFSVYLPEEFTEMNENRILDPDEVLNPFLEQLRLLKNGTLKDSVSIVHIGDSHVRGHIYPQTVGEKLREEFGAVIYTDMGVNGATSLTFTHSQRIEDIAELKPDLLILSFGTNESHNRRYNSQIHYNQMNELMKLLREKMPEVPFLLTTPPGAYESFRQKNRRRTYSVNPRTVPAVETMMRYADKHHLAVWNLYQVAGGGKRAAQNWKAAGLMRPDHVHYMPEGYVLQGELLYEAIIRQYNTYVSF